LEPERARGQDWHNDSAAFLLDLKATLDAAADDRARGVILRRLKKALQEAG
jgi:metallo-beta-lactamase family protein